MANIEEFEVTIPSTTVEGQKVQKRIIDLLEGSNFPPRCIFGVQLALEEAIVNAIKHGNRWDTSKQVRVVCKMSPQRIVIEISDEGPGFDPERVPDPTDAEHLECPGGRGIMLMRSYMSRVEYNQTGNTVVMEKERSNSG